MSHFNLEHVSYYHGSVSKNAVGSLLLKLGDFLVQTVPRAKDCKTLELIIGNPLLILSVMCHSKKIRHWLIKQEDGLFGIEEAIFSSVQEMVDHHLFNGNSIVLNESIVLKNPVVRQSEQALHSSSVPNLSLKAHLDCFAAENDTKTDIVIPLPWIEATKLDLKKCISEHSHVSGKTASSKSSEDLSETEISSDAATQNLSSFSFGNSSFPPAALKCSKDGNLLSTSDESFPFKCFLLSSSSDSTVLLSNQLESVSVSSVDSQDYLGAMVSKLDESESQSSFDQFTPNSSQSSIVDMSMNDVSNSGSAKTPLLSTCARCSSCMQCYLTDNARNAASRSSNIFEFADIYCAALQADVSLLSKIVLAGEFLFAEYKKLLNSQNGLQKDNESR